MMSRVAIDPRSISRLRGRFKRSLIEWVLPLAGLGALAAVPVWAYFFAPQSAAPLVINIMVFGLFPALALWGGYMCTTSYEFDGKNVICRRLESFIIWQDTVSNIEAVEVASAMMAVAAGTLNYLCIRWPHRRRWVIMTSDLQQAIRRNRSDV